MILRVLVVLAFLAVVGTASLTPEMILPKSLAGKISLAILFASLFAVAVQVAYRLRSEIDALKEERAKLPEDERKLILRLRRTAGKVVHCYKSILLRIPVNKSDIQQMQDICGQLRHYSGIYKTTKALIEMASFPLEMIQGDEQGKVFDMVEETYRSFLKECDAILMPSIDPESYTAY